MAQGYFLRLSDETGRELCANSAAALRIPRIVAGTNREMLGQAVKHVKTLKGNAGQKADLFEQLAGQIAQHSRGSWSAVRGSGTDGAHVFLGSLGEALVIDPKGKMFRGSLTTGGIRPAGAAQFSIDYSKLKGIE